MISIVQQKFDKLSKLAAFFFAIGLLHLFGEKTEVEYVYKNEVYTSDHKTKLMDLSIKTTAGYFINFEFHKKDTTEDLIVRNLQYVFDFRANEKKLIKSYILSMGDPLKSVTKAEIWPGLEIEIPTVFFKNMDGDEILNNIKYKVTNNIELNEDDFYNLNFIPFMKHEKSNEEVTKDLCYFVRNIKISEDEKFKLQICQYLLVDIFIPEDEKENMWAVVNMYSRNLQEYEKNLVQNGFNSGYNNGFDNGIELVAKNLKNNNMPLDEIQKNTGLNKKRIKEL